ncbi:LacI family DNA-binding transcriptional regulator [Isoptericola sp. b490]|uniref:LacI family DNA-binding transcriptional regulator n=1 Tax=Actinotalea lenta TaxID=3064654 RepID=UPI002712A231|nr:LacI family DNA-binding transcriptional regulator [Isoptericola sp. b490]MDO8121593.1 LacI family DNA-binding transcriptional regulator [Isoptericola sp. b490]
MNSHGGAPSRGKPATLRQVAELAGVSTATASKALNGRQQVSATTRQRVLDAADRLSFTPNSLAQAMLHGSSGTVGLLTHDLEGRFSIPILMGAEDAFGAGQTSVFLCDSREDAIRERHHIRALLGRRVDGLIVVGSQTNPRRSLGHDLPVPVVYVYAPSSDERDTSVIADNVAAGRLAGQHLVGIGRRRIAHIAGDPTYAAARDREAGIGAALADAGLTQVGPSRSGSWSEAWGRTGAHAVLEAGEPVDAIVCDSDQIARGALDLLRDRGVRVPGDIAVISFDNWGPFATGSRPQLTSIDFNFQQMGRRAAELIFAALAGEPAAGTQAIAPRLVIRGSTTVGA